MLYRLQMLRGAAALAVMMYHFRYLNSHIPEFLREPYVDMLSIGWAGVDLFFVISGFIITKTFYGSNLTPGKFLLKRVIRIYSGYWLVLAAFLVIHPILGISMGRYHLLESITLYPQPKRNAVLGVAWTLSHELFFYAGFAVVMLVPSLRKYILYAAIPFAALLFGIYATAQTSMFYNPVDWLVNPYILEFMAGATIYFMRWQHTNILLWAAIALIAAVGYLNINYFDTTLIQPYQRIARVFLLLPAMFMLVAWAVGENPKPSNIIGKGLVTIGDASYMLYLLHIPVIIATMYLRVGHLWVLASPLVAIGVSIIFHRYAERPIYHYLARRMAI